MDREVDRREKEEREEEEGCRGGVITHGSDARGNDGVHTHTLSLSHTHTHK